jgi:hypothetical protein
MLSSLAAAATLNAIGIPLLRRAESADLTKLRSAAGKIDPTGEVEYLWLADLIVISFTELRLLMDGMRRVVCPG